MGDNIIIGIGCWSLGAVIGGIVVHYIAKVHEFNLRGLTAVVAVLGGAGIIKVFEIMGTQPSVAYWFYPVGLLIGAGGVAALNISDDKSR